MGLYSNLFGDSVCTNNRRHPPGDGLQIQRWMKGKRRLVQADNKMDKTRQNPSIFGLKGDRIPLNMCCNCKNGIWSEEVDIWWNLLE
jgi:hypothetical protein